MKNHLPSRFKTFVQRLLVSIAPLATPRRKPQQLELFASPALEDEAAGSEKSAAPMRQAPAKRPGSRAKAGNCVHLATFV